MKIPTSSQKNIENMAARHARESGGFRVTIYVRAVCDLNHEI